MITSLIQKVLPALAKIVRTSVALEQSVTKNQGVLKMSNATTGRSIPVIPETISLEMQKLIASLPSGSLETPKTYADWKMLDSNRSDSIMERLQEMLRRLNVTMEKQSIGGVNCFVLTPEHISEANRNRLLINVHGGAYVIGSGEGGTGEAILMAGYSHAKVLAIDYRMPPDFPYPAAVDDAMAVWKEVVKDMKPANLAIFGTSAGGAITLALVQRAKDEGLPLPGAIAAGTPWSDLTKTGDTYRTNEFIDTVIPSYDGVLEAAAKLYANGRDLKDPRLSPVYGDFHGFPPAILTSGTRDLFLSNTVRVHRKLRQAGVQAQLQIFEGLSHAFYSFDDSTPETKEAFEEIAGFLDAHLGSSDVHG